MSSADEFRHLFRYDEWANREEVNRLRALASPQPVALRILAHVIGTNWTWLARLQSQTPRLEVWPAISLEECEEEIGRLSAAWSDFFQSCDPSQTIAYTNTKGEPFENRAGDILHHVALHGAYHRGQIALLLRQNGDTPAYTDYIHCVRMGLIDS